MPFSNTWMKNSSNEFLAHRSKLNLKSRAAVLHLLLKKKRIAHVQEKYMHSRSCYRNFERQSWTKDPSFLRTRDMCIGANIEVVTKIRLNTTHSLHYTFSFSRLRVRWLRSLKLPLSFWKQWLYLNLNWSQIEVGQKNCFRIKLRCDH